ncbi:alpha/beta hydrolase [Flavilitoribacter nigricans]|uniref:Acetyl esterase n=1 Tax=Flavilitoribacter nigricans (strain ATCC 23147 / DSM 23189 / NBRC 102662 / NCIMB 1420 / SS-2) TaxID=1122177 RepID=A0A2D0NCF7_FLAN2|nr:alpha/beta hydrolase-fold protein [Flavilitoribacter nigricans]PHN06060.1 acetyl esterase [Flavilitoribacter nigricans DSM 23189 = NBRC 102662]
MSSFRTIEVSDPRFERDGLRHITVKSPHLKSRGDISLFVPSGLSKPTTLPTLILLHGVYGSHWAWSLKGGAHLTAQALIDSGKIPPLLLAMPSDGLWGDGSGYLPHLQADFEKWIMDDVPAAVAAACPHVGPDSPLYIAGLSMGGWGALRLGARYPDRFEAISAHSAITRWSEMKDFVEEDIDRIPIPDTERTAFQLLQASRAQLPPLRFDCGREDPLLPGNRLLHQQLTQAGIPHHYEEYPGGHEWPYWEKHLEESLIFCTSGRTT